MLFASIRIEAPYTFGLFYSFSFQRSTLFVALFQQLLYLNRLLSECQQLFLKLVQKSVAIALCDFVIITGNQLFVNNFF
jgi:hypothetical protein